MTTQFSGGDAEDLSRRLRALLEDVERVASGRGPSAAELSRAPVLTGWWQAAAVMPVLAGAVEDPSRGGRRLVQTSQLYVFDQQQGWARTFSRFYRLGASSNDLRNEQ